MTEFQFRTESYQLIGIGMEVHKNLGCGFLESVYQEAFEFELSENNIPYQREAKLKIIYKGILLSKEFCADFVCYDKIIVELKAVNALDGGHVAQVINYLKATGYKVGLLLNFGERSLVHKRIVY
jgi:GxxExxY protein